MRTICASSVSLPTRSRLHDEGAGAVHRAAGHLASPASFSTGIDSPVTIDSSTVRRAFEHDAVDGDAFAGPHAQAVADVHLLQRHVLFGAVGVDPCAPSVGARPSRLRMAALVAAARAKFQHLAEQHEHDDDRRRFEVDRRPRPSFAERSGNSPGASVATTL